MQVNAYQLCALLVVISLSSLILYSGIQMLSWETESLAFQGPRWHHPGETVEAEELLNAKYARVESHTIRTSSGSIVSGWLWFDFHDTVNVLVETSTGDFLVFEQTNYGLSKASLAVLSKHLSQYQDPLTAARNELAKELGRTTTEWINLGTFRTDANRGGGYVTSFLARKTVLMDQSERGSSNDLEARAIVRLSRSELLAALMKNRVREAKWSNTISLALLWLSQH
eukprot:m.264670 g.264670  ORF g.264670 m.264670 type:complete len:227 (+) comp15620_c0_seq1:135-815(+)